MVAQRTTIPFSLILGLGLFFACSMAQSPATFDVQPLLAVRPIERSDLAQSIPGSHFVEMRLNVSSMIDSRFDGEVSEFLFKIESRRRDVQVADYWPKTELGTSTIGAVDVAAQAQQQKQANIHGFAASPGVGYIDGDASYREQLHLQRVYSERPSMYLISASGTIARRSGAYFKFKATPQSSLEGVHTIVLHLEVPAKWRGDLLEITCESLGNSRGSRSLETLTSNRFMIATYVEGDMVAANVAKGHIVFEQRLRQSAEQYRKEISRRSSPSPLHKLGVALDVVEPEIPRDWLAEVLFSRTTIYPSGALAKLPVNVRVAILDYLEHQEVMELLATGNVRNQENNNLSTNPKIALGR